MASFMKEFEHLKIQLEEINSATENFDKSKVIGSGGFGKVYKGELSHYKGRSIVALKRLDRRHGQGDPEFWKEIMMLSRYSNENLISLLGFCDEGGEKILVYEYASHGSLDRHLHSTALSWRHRIKICLDAARGLSYLHEDKGLHQRVLHRDIKSSNILLDHNWNAKVSDMGLSKLGPANQQHTAFFTNVVGTFGYLDPVYMGMGVLTKESDVYSFGVVLFEVLCGRLCFDPKNHGCIFVAMWKQHYEEKKLDKIIFKDLKEPMNPTSLEVFSEIAYRCLHGSREERPAMAHIVEKLEVALEFQVRRDPKIPKEYEEILMAAVSPLIYRSEEELKLLLSKGVYLNEGKTGYKSLFSLLNSSYNSRTKLNPFNGQWLSLNMNGVRCEMISIAKCLIPIAGTQSRYSTLHNSRFAVGCYEPLEQEFKILVKTQFLSRLISYTVNLVFKINKKPKQRYVGLDYKLAGETTFYSFLSDEREDGWLTAELFQFTCDEQIVDLEILFDKQYCPNLLVDGIEFQPMEKEEDEKLKDENADMQHISDSDTYWEQKLPTDYRDIIKWSKHGVHFSTKKELYSILCDGFLINNGEEWFSLGKDGKKCLMLSARAVLEEERWRWESLPNTRFEVAHHPPGKFGIFCKVESKILSPQTIYTAYLVFKQENTDCVQPGPAQVKDKNSRLEETYHIYLRTPQTPVITRNFNQITHNESHRPKIKGLPLQRSDGWMEVQVWEFQTDTTTKMIPMHVELSSYDKSLIGMEVCGIEFRPI